MWSSVINVPQANIEADNITKQRLATMKTFSTSTL